jgi:hypothetical protein
MDFDRLVFPPAPAFLVAGLWYLLLHALCSEVRAQAAVSQPAEKQPCTAGRVLDGARAAASTQGSTRPRLRTVPQGVAWGLFGGGLVGYVLYDTTHYGLHRGMWTPAMLDGQLKSAHLYHHYEDEMSGFGISSRLYDLVFRTLPKRKQHAM